jgi:hypothetical protein
MSRWQKQEAQYKILESDFSEAEIIHAVASIRLFDRKCSEFFHTMTITSVKMMQGIKNSHYRHACAKGKSIAPTHS